MDNKQQNHTTHQDIVDALSAVPAQVPPQGKGPKKGLAPLLISIGLFVSALFVIVAVLLPGETQDSTDSATNTLTQNSMSVPVQGFLDKVAVLNLEEATPYLNKESLIYLLGVTQKTLNKFAGSETLWNTCSLRETQQYRTRQITQDNRDYSVVYVPVLCDTEALGKKQLVFDVRKSGEDDWLIYDIVAYNYEQ